MRPQVFDPRPLPSRTPRAARSTRRGIEERRLEGGQWLWRLLPYNAGAPKQFATEGAAARYAATLAARKGHTP